MRGFFGGIAALTLTIFLGTLSAFAWDVSESNLKNDVTTLAQPAWEGRLAGSPGGKKAREWIKQKFLTLGLQPQEQPILGSMGRTLGANILVSIGQDPKISPDSSCVMIGAHYDHLGKTKTGYYPGADDNATGVAVLFEIARLVSAKKIPGCLILAAWDFEEGSIKTGGGLKGSKYFVKHPLFPLKKIGLSLTFDLLGSSIVPGAEKKLFAFGSEFSKDIRTRLKNLAVRNELEVEPISTKIIEPFGAAVPRSDYGPFRSAGIPYLFFSTGTSHHYHRSSDTPDKINYSRLTQITDAVLELSWPYLARDQKLEELSSEPSEPKEVKQQDLALTKTLLTNMSKYLEQSQAATCDQNKIKTILDRLSTYSSAESVRTCELQSAFFRMLETNHVKAPIPPRIIRLLLFCPIK